MSRHCNAPVVVSTKTDFVLVPFSIGQLTALYHYSCIGLSHNGPCKNWSGLFDAPGTHNADYPIGLQLSPTVFMPLSLPL